MKLKADCCADAGDNHFRGCQWGEGHEEYPLWKLIYLAVIHLQGKAGFSRTCQANQDDQAAGRILKRVSQSG